MNNEKRSVDNERHCPFSIRRENDRPRIDGTSTNPDNKVAGGTIRWKPVDRLAAKLLSKASYINHPPEPAPRFRDKITQIQIPNPKMKTQNPILNPNIIATMEARSERAVDQTEDLANRAESASAAMRELCNAAQSEWTKYQEIYDVRIKELRMTRIAAESELRQLMASLREVRRFFLDEAYTAERERLKEFVELCERLQALKSSGFLDDISETLLRLSYKPQPEK